MLKNQLNLRFFITTMLLGVNIFVFAQKSNAYESIGSAAGLSQGMVLDMLQDKEGFIWAATKDGLNKYDGYKFKVFTYDPNNLKSLSSNSIIRLFEDSKGRIWVGTENEGLNVYNKKNGNFYRIVHKQNNENGLTNNIIKIIEELPNGKILVATEDGKINIITLPDNYIDSKTPPLITHITLPNNAKIYGIGNDNQGNSYIGGMDGTVYKYLDETKSFTRIENVQLLNNGYLTLEEDVLINNNLYLYNGKEVTPLFNTKKIQEGNIILKPNQALWDNHHREQYYYDISPWMPNKTLQWGLKLASNKRIIYPFIFDKSGLLWSGTVGYGLKKFNIAKNNFNAQLNAFSTYYILPNGNDDVYYGDVAYSWKRVTKNVIDENAFSTLPSLTNIDNFLITKSGDYWFKSDNDGYFKYDPFLKKLTPYPFINNFEGRGSKQPLLEDSKGNIWFPALGGSYTLYNAATQKTTTLVYNSKAAQLNNEKAIATALYEDKKGSFWIGSFEGFAKINFDNTENTEPKIKWYYNENNSNSLNYSHVTCFTDDPMDDNYLWITTRGGGLNRLNKTTGAFTHLTVKNGLPDNVVYGILVDDAKNIWGSTNKGLFCLHTLKDEEKNNWQFSNFTKEDGLQENEFNTNAYAKLLNGNLIFGGVNGINIFDPKEILAKNYKPEIFITDILINNIPVLPNDKTGVLKQTAEFTKTITLNHLQDILTLEFAGLDFTTTNQNKYRYQLVGIDKEWVENGTKNIVTYLHLPAGTYTFKVQTSNSQGKWSENIAELKIIILPPWWLSWWAWGIYIIIFGAAIAAFFKFKINETKLQSQLNFEQEEAKRIKEIDLVKTQLYTNITHEFRTPLTVILGMAQQIQNNTKEYLENGLNMIIRNGQSLLNLVNEMLDLSKLESGKMELQTQQGNVVSFLRYIVESFQSLAESQQKQLHFLTDIESLYIEYDAEKIRQIISNLLSNALKFTPNKGNVYITVTKKDVLNSQQKITLTIKVKDTGIGIPENQIQNIFNRFYQLDNSHTRKAEGTGIGLSLTKELVKLMGGNISVKSPPTGANSGSEFTVTLPFNKIDSAAIHTTNDHDSITNTTSILAPNFEQSAKTQNLQSALILLVEDNADVVAYTASCLPHYKLAVGRDGREGFEIAKDIIPDLIITDVMMPFVDGFEMCRNLRKDELTSHIPIIMLTAKADLESRLEGLEKGADVYLEKPFHKEELLLRIKKLLEQRKKLQQYYSKKIGISNEKEVTIAEVEIAIVEQPIENEFLQKLRIIIEANYVNYEFNVEQLCKLIFMSHSQLHRKLDGLTGQSPNKFIRAVKLNSAKILLQTTDKSISIIALETGYNDAGYFTRVFKQEFGETPLEWRKKKGC